MIAGTVVLISFLFPEDLRFKYQFSENSIWRYEDYQAPFDFAIKKSPDELLRQKNEALERVIPFYDKTNYDYLKEFLADANEVNLPQDQIDKVIDLFDLLYKFGVYQRTDTFSNESIHIVHQSKVSLAERKNVYSISDAREEYVKQCAEILGNASSICTSDLIQPSLKYNNELTEEEYLQLVSKRSTVKGKVSEGEMIVRKGQIVDSITFMKLQTLKEEYEQNESLGSKYWNVWIGYFLITALCIVIFILYLIRNSYEVFSNFAQFSFVLFWLLAFSYLVYFVEGVKVLSIYLLPFCVVPIVIKNFFGERIAFITFLFVVIISSFLSTYGYEFTIIQLLAGIVAIVADFNPKNWMSFFKSLAYIALVYILAYFTLNIVETGDVALLDWRGGSWLVVSAFLNLLAYPFIPLFERIFGFTSSVRLTELSDLERPLLKELAIRAPGTFQHSLQVANLSEAAAKSIGANASLVRTAALYHDIGKMRKPKFFVENSDGHNYHNDLSPEESAKIIIDHVLEGEKMAKKHRLPGLLIRFIRTHHGTTRVEYFYQKALAEQIEESVDAKLYTYPGPKPETKEETIMMLADSLEAASKSLKEPTLESLEILLNKIVDGKISSGQLVNSALSFDELDKIKGSFLYTLKSIYHGRIKYPES